MPARSPAVRKTHEHGTDECPGTSRTTGPHCGPQLWRGHGAGFRVPGAAVPGSVQGPGFGSWFGAPGSAPLAPGEPGITNRTVNLNRTVHPAPGTRIRVDYQHVPVYVDSRQMASD